MKIKGPMHSDSASGLFGQRIVFSRRASGQQARLQRAQKDVSSSARTQQRLLYNMGVSLWNDLTDYEKSLFVSDSMSGYNLFMKEYLLSPFDSNILSIYGQRIYGHLIYGLES